MITDKYLKMMSEIGVRSLIRGKDDYSDELEMLMREHQQRRQQEASDIERELNIYRSGSAPPTIEGSLNGLIGRHGGVVGRVGLSEEEIRSDPAYIKYYYSHVNLNPRLPPPLFSKEDRRFSQRSVGGGGGSGNGSSSSSMVVGNRRPVNGVSVDEEEVGDRSMFAGKNMEKEIGMGLRQKSFAEIIQGNSESHHTHLQPNMSSFDSNIHSFQKMGSLGSQTYASALGSSLSRSTTPDPQLVSKATSRIPQVVGSALGSDDFAQDVNVHGDLVSALSGLNLSANNLSEEGSNPNAQIHHQNMYHLQNDHNPLEKYSPSNKNESMQFHRSSLPYSSSYLRSPSTPLQYTGLNSPSQYPNFDSRNSSFSTFDLGTGVMNPADIAAARSMGPDTRGLSGRLNSRPNSLTAAAELQNLIRVDNQMDPLYLQYSRSTDYVATQANSSMEMLKLQKSYLEWLLMQQNSQYGLPYANNPGGLNNGYYGNTANSLGLSYPGSMGSVLPHSPIGSGSPIWQGGDRNIGFSPGMMGAWDESFSLSLLDQFKSSKTKCFELSEIAGHVVEFSADQYGSRFIQQKLETASLDEKEMVYLEIMPHALSLMTDVFGNYVIQKFLEHGSPSHIRELADQLMGHVLELSLQMYGCRVIQKAIEVVDLDQKIKMVKELEGSVVRCVRDQNGNHVIQKCIECIPEDAIQFIVTTFYDQVVTFSSHPYGCRVIQRILENCRDPKTQSKVMDEVLRSVCMLAQDQYGNYVVQHVLEHGQPHERSTIISNFIGQIVQMSYQKFASNVVEKCLTFGSVEERQILVNEMLGSTDENEPLQVMMKDQYANYVVQKVLETCDDQQLELILDRIKIHLNALKKYTYGKHIVARVEKLVAAGERRIGILASQSGQIS